MSRQIIGPDSYEEVEIAAGGDSTEGKSKYSNWHTYWSYLKSVIRIVACIFGANGSLVLFAAGMGIAECIGIIEELG